MKNYMICTNRKWALEAFLETRSDLPGNWIICVSPKDMKCLAESFRPRYVFFPHWSFIVPDFFLKQYECVCFHMTDVPYGRGGSPLQNLISRGHKSTMLSALRMIKELDAGPVYYKHPLSLDGTAAEIFARASRISMQMTKDLVAAEPTPEPQQGACETFFRRKPYQSELPNCSSAVEMYDHIRMLDAPGYPPAFVEHGEWHAIFSDAKIVDDVVEARVRLKKGPVEK